MSDEQQSGAASNGEPQMRDVVAAALSRAASNPPNWRAGIGDTIRAVRTAAAFEARNARLVLEDARRLLDHDGVDFGISDEEVAEFWDRLPLYREDVEGWDMVRAAVLAWNGLVKIDPDGLVRPASFDEQHAAQEEIHGHNAAAERRALERGGR